MIVTKEEAEDELKYLTSERNYQENVLRNES